jgi:hypothetical protein
MAVTGDFSGIWLWNSHVKGKIMKTVQKTSLFDSIVAAFALTHTFGFAYRDSVRDLKAAQKRLAPR